jgi:hypothetical protein
VRAEVLDEAAMVERGALCTRGVWYMYGLSGVEDCVAMHGDGIDDAVRLGEGAFKEGNVERCGARCGRRSLRCLRQRLATSFDETWDLLDIGPDISLVSLRDKDSEDSRKTGMRRSETGNRVCIHDSHFWSLRLAPYAAPYLTPICLGSWLAYILRYR